MANTGGLSGGLSYSGFSTPKTKTENVVVGGEGGIDVREFKGLSRALKATEPELRLKLLRNLKAIGDLVAKDAQAIIAPHSETIPPTIKSMVRGESVRVRAGNGEVAIAGLFELGNKGGGKSQAAAKSGVFRHPVYGKNTWVNQPMARYLAPALEKNLPAITEMALEALDEAIQTLIDSNI